MSKYIVMIIVVLAATYMVVRPLQNWRAKNTDKDDSCGGCSGCSGCGCSQKKQEK